MKPTAKSNIWAVLLLSAFPSACSSKLGAKKMVRRLPRDDLLGHRCGDQFGDTLCPGGPMTSARSRAGGRTRPIAKELRRRGSSAPLARVRGRNMLSEMLSVEVDGRLPGRSFDVEVADNGRA